MSCANIGQEAAAAAGCAVFRVVFFLANIFLDAQYIGHSSVFWIVQELMDLNHKFQEVADGLRGIVEVVSLFQLPQTLHL